MVLKQSWANNLYLKCILYALIISQVIIYNHFYKWIYMYELLQVDIYVWAKIHRLVH